MKWEDVKDVLKWTLKHARYLDPDEDPYLIEKEVDKCHLAMMQREREQEDSAESIKREWEKRGINRSSLNSVTGALRL